MPKQKRRTRLQIPMDQDVYDAITDFANRTGRSRASVAEELITEAVPALNRMTLAMEAMDVDMSGGLRDMAEMILQAAAEARQMGLELDEAANR